MVSTTTRIGWAVAYCSLPVQATANYRVFVKGVPTQEMSAQATLRTTRYMSVADKLLAIAIANPMIDTPANVILEFRDTEGRAVGGSAIANIPASGHTSFYLYEKLPGVGSSSGSLHISSADPPHDEFVAWTLGSDDLGIWSTLPPGPLMWPISHWDRIWLVYLDVANVAVKTNDLTSVPELRILGGLGINAYAEGGSRVEITLGLSQLISDSPSELAFVIGHELGHIYQQRNNNQLLFDTNPESDADYWGIMLALGAGYDPYGIAGALGKFSMASGEAGLITQFLHEHFSVHRSFNTRLESAFNTLRNVCNSDPTLKALCNEYKRKYHPNLPAIAPLEIPPVIRK